MSLESVLAEIKRDLSVLVGPPTAAVGSPRIPIWDLSDWHGEPVRIPVDQVGESRIHLLDDECVNDSEGEQLREDGKI